MNERPAKRQESTSEWSEQPEGRGLSILDMPDLPEPMRGLFSWMMREHEVGVAQVSTKLGVDQAAALATLAALVEQGLVRVVNSPAGARYSVLFANKRTRAVASEIWSVFDDKKL